MTNQNCYFVIFTISYGMKYLLFGICNLLNIGDVFPYNSSLFENINIFIKLRKYETILQILKMIAINCNKFRQDKINTKMKPVNAWVELK